MYRIIKKEKGFIVEIQVVKWTLFGVKKQWKPFILTSGLNEVWHHKTFDLAMMNLLDEIKFNNVFIK